MHHPSHLLLLALAAGCGQSGSLSVEDEEDADCPRLEIAVSSVAFEDAPIGDAVVQELSLTNACDGETDLEVTGTLPPDADDDGFALRSRYQKLSPGETGILEVEFRATDYGSVTTVLTVSTNDPEQPTLEVPLSGTASTDQDGDGHDAEAVGGTDCDDQDEETWDGAPESWYDGVDQDCGGDSDYDQDGDGYESDAYGGTDCDDTDADTWPGAPEVWYDGVDQDCAGDSDYDQDGDGSNARAYSGTDCDDTDPDVYRGAKERWNGIDDDCDGLADDVDVDDAAVGSVDGDAGTYVGYHHGLSVGDVDQDGEAELLVGSLYANYYRRGGVWLLPMEDRASFSGSLTDFDDAAVTGGANYNYAGSMGPVQGDVTGDGDVDLVIGGYGDGYYCTDCPVVTVYEGAGSLSGKLDAEDAKTTIQGSTTGTATVMSHLDLNGDGAAEVVIGEPYSYSSSSVYQQGYIRIFDVSDTSGSMTIAAHDTRFTGGASYDYLGAHLGGGDLDGDGYDDGIYCATGADSGLSWGNGVAYLVHGGTSLPDDGSMESRYDVRIEGKDGYDFFCQSDTPQVADFDGDGDADLAIAAPSDNRVYVFLDATFAGSSYDTTDADLVIEGGSTPDSFGFALVSGDFDGDGMSDLAVGAPDSTSYTADASTVDATGHVYGFSGATMTGDLDEGDAIFTLQGESIYDLFGRNMIATDMDGDGKDDLVIAAPNSGTGKGRVYLVESP